jgi:hydroxyethylthiazole kinase-like sugar kinase family protein
MIDTGSPKVGCFIGDYTKTSIGTLINTGTMIGMMSNILGAGCLLPKVVPSFIMFMDDKFFKTGIKQQLGAAHTAMGRRTVELSEAEEALLRFLFNHLREERMELIRKSRKELLAQKGINL